MKAITLYCFSILFTLTLLGCENDEEMPTKYSGLFKGSEVNVGDGKAYTFVELNDNEPVAVGIAIQEDAMENLPTAHHTEFLLPLPNVLGEIPFKHVTLDWESHGHDPEGVYDLPHFDMHFYLISNSTRLAMVPEDPKMEFEPDAKYIPEGYFPTPGFPFMGKHWLDGSSPEWNGEVFTHTFIYGSYDGKVSFYEPMITKDYLLSNPNVTINIQQPSAFAQSGFFPNKYQIKFDPQEKVYKIALINFEKRSSE